MKQSVLAATLLAGLAAAHGDRLAAVHRRQHNVATQHTDVTTTTTTTIWVPHPSDGPGGQPQQSANPSLNLAANPPASNVAPLSSSTSPIASQTTPAPAANQPGTPGFDPNAWQASQAAIQSSHIAAQQSVNSQQMSINGLPPQSAPSQPVPTVATVPIQSVPVQPSQPVSSSSGAQPTSGAPSGGAGGSQSTHLTYYNAGPAACGGTYTDDDPIVAMAAAQLKCGAKMKITGPAGTFTATAVDKCGACESDGHIDGAYNFAYKISGYGRDQGPLYQNGQVPITWEWI